MHYNKSVFIITSNSASFEIELIYLFRCCLIESSGEALLKWNSFIFFGSTPLFIDNFITDLLNFLHRACANFDLLLLYLNFVFNKLLESKLQGRGWGLEISIFSIWWIISSFDSISELSSNEVLFNSSFKARIWESKWFETTSERLLNSLLLLGEVLKLGNVNGFPKEGMMKGLLLFVKLSWEFFSKSLGIIKLFFWVDEIFFKPLSLGTINCFFVKSYLTQEQKKQRHEKKREKTINKNEW